jgi:hypothetical protein
VHAAHDVGHRVLDLLGRVVGQQRREDLGVRGGGETDAGLPQLGVQLDRIDEVPVVGERELMVVGAVDRLRVLPRVGPRRGIADVADRELAAERAQLLLVEDLRDEPALAQGHDVAAAIAARDARRLLPAVLKRVEGEVRESCDVVPRSVGTEDAALVARPVAGIELSGIERHADHRKR